MARMTNEQCAHEWAHARQSGVGSENLHIWANGVLASYRTPIAIRLSADLFVVMLSDKDTTTTTTMHLAMARRAIPHDARMIFLPYIDTDVGAMIDLARKHYRNRCGRTRTFGVQTIRDLDFLRDEICKIAQIYSLPSEPDLIPEKARQIADARSAGSLRAAATTARLAAERRRMREEEERRKEGAKARRDEAMTALAAWQQGRLQRFPHDLRWYLDADYIRIEGADVVTTREQSLPLSLCRRVLAQFKDAPETAVGVEVGPYKIGWQPQDRMVLVGCHRFHLEHLIEVLS